MPSLLATAGSSSSAADQSYSPLADEVNPSFGNIAPAPVVAHDGTIVYGKRIPEHSSSTFADSEDRDERRAHLRSESEETLSPNKLQKGKQRVMNGYDHEDGDMGELKKDGGTIGVKGKAKQWDPEQGMVEREGVVDVDDGRYPPVNETEEEERRVQENLARFTARDMARRRAARISRQLPASPIPGSPPSSPIIDSYVKRPFSMLSSMSPAAVGGKRNSIMGLMEGIVGYPKAKESPRWGRDEMLPVATSQNGLYNNPYDTHDTQPKFSPIPKMVISPTSPPEASPFADPVPAATQTRRESLVSASSGNSSHSPLHSPTEATSYAYGYAGPAWRGGGASQGDTRTVGGDKWWHALCAWGTDLDGGPEETDQSGQAGRTNPNE